MTKCILFDSDGTLVDSELLCNRAIAIKFKELGVDLCEHDLMLRFRGGKMSEVLAQLSEQNDVGLTCSFEHARCRTPGMLLGAKNHVLYM